MDYLALKNADGTYSLRRLLNEHFPESTLMELPPQYTTLEAVQWLFSLNKDIRELSSDNAPSGCEVHQWPTVLSESFSNSENLNFVAVEQPSALNNLSWETIHKFLPENHRSYNFFLYENNEWNIVAFGKEHCVYSLKCSKIIGALYDLFAEDEYVFPGDVDELIQDVEIQLNDFHSVFMAIQLGDIVEAYEWLTVQSSNVVSAFLTDWNTSDFMQWLNLCPEIQASLTKRVLEKHVDDSTASITHKKM